MHGYRFWPCHDWISTLVFESLLFWLAVATSSEFCFYLIKKNISLSIENYLLSNLFAVSEWGFPGHVLVLLSHIYTSLISLSTDVRTIHRNRNLTKKGPVSTDTVSMAIRAFKRFGISHHKYNWQTKYIKKCLTWHRKWRSYSLWPYDLTETKQNPLLAQRIKMIFL